MVRDREVTINPPTNKYIQTCRGVGISILPQLGSQVSTEYTFRALEHDLTEFFLYLLY